MIFPANPGDVDRCSNEKSAFPWDSREFQSKTSISMGKKRLFQLLGPDPEITTASGVLELREPLGLDC